jgi:hypothetical protein
VEHSVSYTKRISWLPARYPRRDYPAKLRRIKFYDASNDRLFVFLTKPLWPFVGFAPDFLLVLSSMVDLLIISTLAIYGIAMVPLPLYVVAGEFVAAVIFGLILDAIKIPVFTRLKIS